MGNCLLNKLFALLDSHSNGCRCNNTNKKKPPSIWLYFCFSAVSDEYARIYELLFVIRGKTFSGNNKDILSCLQKHYTLIKLLFKQDSKNHWTCCSCHTPSLVGTVSFAFQGHRYVQGHLSLELSRKLVFFSFLFFFKIGINTYTLFRPTVLVRNEFPLTKDMVWCLYMYSCHKLG